MPIWSTNRIIAFLAIWALVIPFKLMLRLNQLRLSIIYAGLWSYLGGANPYSDSPLIVSGLFTVFMLPFYAPGLASAWLVWYGSKNENLTRQRFIETNVMLILIQALLAMIIPCVMADTLCIPTPTTGIVALFFVSKVVKEIEVPWSENDTEHVSVPAFDDMIRVSFRTTISSMLRGGKSSRESKEVHEEVEEEEHIDEL
jgi:hypothetical protein